MLVLYKAKQAREEEVERIRYICGIDKSVARQKARSHFNQVTGMMHRFIIIVAYNRAPSSMDSILRMRAYSKAVRVGTNVESVVDWHSNELLLGHMQFSIVSLQIMVWIIAFGDWGRLVDNTAEMRLG
jgi:hypothetical protein